MTFLIVVIIFIIVSYVKRKKYTREKFAFLQMTNLFIFAAVTVIPIITGNSLLSMLAQILNNIFDWNLTTSSTYADKALSAFIFFGLIWIINKVHSNWDGQISERSYRMDKDSIRTRFLLDVIAQINKDDVQIHIPKEESDLLVYDSLNTCDAKTRIAELLMAFSPQYKINPKDDWYEEYDCFLSVFGKDNTPVIIHCPEGRVTIKTVEKLQELKPKFEFCDYNYTVIFKETKEIIEGLDQLTFNNTKIYSEADILDDLLNIQSYKEYICEKVSKEHLPGGCSLTLNDTYVESNAKICNTEEEIPIVSYIENWIEQDQEGHLAILGEYGQGKSTLSYILAYEVLQYQQVKRLPVILELRGKSPRTSSKDELIFTWCNNFGITPAAFHALNTAGRLVIIFEGFDEMDLVGDAEIRMAHFKSLWRYAENLSEKLIFTGRPNFFFDQEELQRALIVKTSVNTKKYCTTLRLLPFKNDQVREALRSFPKTVRRSIIKLVTSNTTSHHISELLRRPSALIWAAAAWEKLKVSLKANDLVSADVIGAILEQSFDRQLNKNLTTSILALEREYLMVGIALVMHKNCPGVNQISASELSPTSPSNKQNQLFSEHFPMIIGISP